MKFGTDGLAAVEQDGKWGFIKENGEIVIPFQFDGVSGTFSNGTAVVYEGEFIGNYAYALIDIHGNFISNGYEYESVVPLSETNNKKLIEVCKNGKWGFIDVENGGIILPIEYEHIDEFYKNQEGEMSAVRYLEATDTEGYFDLEKPELLDENGNVVFSYENYIDLLWYRSKYTEEDIVFYGFLEPYGDNGWAVCGDGDIALWFDEEGKIQLDLEGYTEAGKFICVK
ncbi:MAG TPA: WG repeat-containing protein [Candidatus Mediterraneibacter norfolkensis]|nr:WG repeat-containing protein [Candidatus Mediterraneibacter norfolkensis]